MHSNIALYFSACRQPNYEVLYRPTLHIDTGVYKQLEKKFGVFLFKAPDYLGGLTPNYPIVAVSQLMFDNHGIRLTRDTDWVFGSFFPSAKKIAVKIKNDYILINNRKELQKIYAPISSRQEALAYAVLYTKSFAAFKDFFEKKQYSYISDKPDASYSIKKDDYYVVHLFSYVSFGCSHPYYSETMQVNKDGSVKMLSKVRSFTNPTDNGLCVD